MPKQDNQSKTVDNNIPIQKDVTKSQSNISIYLNKVIPPELKVKIHASQLDSIIHRAEQPVEINAQPANDQFIYPTLTYISDFLFERIGHFYFCFEAVLEKNAIIQTRAFNHEAVRIIGEEAFLQYGKLIILPQDAYYKILQSKQRFIRPANVPFYEFQKITVPAPHCDNLEKILVLLGYRSAVLNDLFQITDQNRVLVPKKIDIGRVVKYSFTLRGNFYVCDHGLTDDAVSIRNSIRTSISSVMLVKGLKLIQPGDDNTNTTKICPYQLLYLHENVKLSFIDGHERFYAVIHPEVNNEEDVTYIPYFQPQPQPQPQPTPESMVVTQQPADMIHNELSTISELVNHFSNIPSMPADQKLIELKAGLRALMNNYLFTALDQHETVTPNNNNCISNVDSLQTQQNDFDVDNNDSLQMPQQETPLPQPESQIGENELALLPEFYDGVDIDNLIMPGTFFYHSNTSNDLDQIELTDSLFEELNSITDLNPK